MLDATLLSSPTYGRLALMNQRNDLALSWDVGWGKPSDLDDAGTSAGDARLALVKSLQLTDRLSAPLRIEYDTA